MVPKMEFEIGEEDPEFEIDEGEWETPAGMFPSKDDPTMDDISIEMISQYLYAASTPPQEWPKVIAKATRMLRSLSDQLTRCIRYEKGRCPHYELVEKLKSRLSQGSDEDHAIFLVQLLDDDEDDHLNALFDVLFEDAEYIFSLESVDQRVEALNIYYRKQRGYQLKDLIVDSAITSSDFNPELVEWNPESFHC